MFWSCNSPRFWSWLSQHVHLGDLPTWLAAVGGLAVAGFAFGQLRAVRQQLSDIQRTQGKQLELLELEIKDRRADQARHVLVKRLLAIEWQDPGTVTEDGFAQAIRVVNDSTGSISDLAAQFEDAGGSIYPAIYCMHPDGWELARGWTDNPAQRDLYLRNAPLPRLDHGLEIYLIGPVFSKMEAASMQAEVQFTDASGRRWRVDHKGQLAEHDPD